MFVLFVQYSNLVNLQQLNQSKVYNVSEENYMYHASQLMINACFLLQSI